MGNVWSKEGGSEMKTGEYKETWRVMKRWRERDLAGECQRFGGRDLEVVEDVCQTQMEVRRVEIYLHCCCGPFRRGRSSSVTQPRLSISEGGNGPHRMREQLLIQLPLENGFPPFDSLYDPFICYTTNNHKPNS